MGSMTFSEFEADAKAQGFDQILERQWKPLTVLDVHTHPFAAQALVVDGEMWLTVGGNTQQLHAGDRFELDAGVPHAERYGSEGATYWVARRNGPAGA